MSGAGGCGTWHKSSGYSRASLRGSVPSSGHKRTEGALRAGVPPAADIPEGNRDISRRCHRRKSVKELGASRQGWEADYQSRFPRPCRGARLFPYPFSGGVTAG